MTKRIVYLDEAADILGLSKEALRKRIQRGSIEATKDEAGRWLISLPDNVQDAAGGHVQAIKDIYILELRERIRSLEQDKEYFKKALDRRDEEVAWLNMKKLQLESELKLLLEAPKEPRSWWPFNQKRGD